MMEWLLVLFLVGLGVIISLIFACYNFRKGTKMEHGTPKMQDIAKAIRLGASTFLKREYITYLPILGGISVVFGIIFAWQAGIAFLLGMLMS